MKTFQTLLLTALLIIPLYAQTDSLGKGLNSINSETVKGQLEFLASDWMEGRETGTRGCYMAGDYIASMFKVFCIQPAGDVEWTRPSRAERRAGKHAEQIQTYFQNIGLLAYEPGNEQVLKLKDKDGRILSFNYKSDFSLSTGTVGIEAEAPVVFVGYGYRNDEEGYDDFEDVDVKGKFIVRLWGYPGYKDTSSQAYKKFHPEGRYALWYMRRDKDEIASEKGALGVIEINPDEDESLSWADNFPFRYNTEYYEGVERLRPGSGKRMTIPGDTLNSRLTTITLSNRIANELLNGTGVSLEKFEEEVAKEMEPDSKVLDGKKLYLKTNVNSRIVKARNVVGMIEGENKDEIIMIGAHYDHVGMKDGYIWNGSDDNASGTVGMLTVAKAVAATGIKPKRTIVFAAWTGEEKGLLGSRYFADNFKDIGKVKFYLNYDMISRNDEDDTLGNKFSMSYSGDYPRLEEISKKFNKDLNLGLDISYRPAKQPRGGSDHSSFAAKNVPVAYYFGGFHPDYHGISDHADKADYDKMMNVIKLGFKLVWELANTDEPLSPQLDNK